MLTRFNSQLREEKFEDIYDEASDSVHLNVNKEEFVRRMKVAVGKLKSIDKELAFQTGREIEWEVFGHSEYDDSSQFRRVQKLEKENISVGMLVYWENSGLFPKFNDFAVVGGEYSQKYRTPGVSYKTISNPENY